MFAQANCEHCRHKIFNADFDRRRRARRTAVAVRDDPQHAREAQPGGVLSAYKDNAAVIEGTRGGALLPDPTTASTRAHREPIAHPR